MELVGKRERREAVDWKRRLREATHAFCAGQASMMTTTLFPLIVTFLFNASTSLSKVL
ncbi:hypothetical protein BDV33DRAFT_183894 [Aspergillus novoparasiticus]|uniref:Uncharacterized protein n=1 Tax=Aspergillus novoparasiticus TaxID=986946 RepID=A0A5N6EBS9_9EURO|nr:hypothetical protein BDV33DRAFT_183894 [Aspergillus novoparasiticus]